MKKLVFAIQTIVLLAMFPVYMIVDLSHTKEKLPVKDPALEIQLSQEEIHAGPALNPNDDLMIYLTHN